ncbi:MAG: SsrA-binding protein SmpB [FCB group bacterium]|nr:SsrA-binding protein SmpB [FCB group bacterium]
MKDKDKKLVAKNRRAFHDYEVMERLEAGLALQGTEVKALREGRCNLKDSYAEIRRGEIFLVKMHIGEYSAGNIFNHEPERPRKLLLHRREIKKLSVKVSEKGFTLIPLSVYFTRGLAKVEIGLVRGKRQYDKRKAIEERDRKRDMEREVKERIKWG